MSKKEMYLQGWEREFQTTMKVLQAYPAEQAGFHAARAFTFGARAGVDFCRRGSVRHSSTHQIN